MLQKFYEAMTAEILPILRDTAVFFNNTDISTYAPEMLNEWQTTLQTIGHLLEEKYNIDEDSPCIHLLEGACESLYQLSLKPDRTVQNQLISLLDSFESALAASVSIYDSKLAIVAIMKNEAPYLDEFICYHLIAGVDHFFFYNNESTDNTEELLKPYIKRGLVTLIDIPGSHVQKLAYEHALSNYRLETEWMAFIDLDEFIVPSDHTRSIPDVINEIIDNHNRREHKWKQVGGVGINWIVYGTGHHREPVDGLITEHYLDHASRHCPDNSHIKVIVNPLVTAGFPDSPHNVAYISDEYCTISERGSYIDGSPFFFDASYEWIHINHYSTKSETEYIEKICRKGWPDQEHIQRSEDDPLTQRLLNKAKTEWSEVHDTNMIDFVPSIQKKIQSMRS